MHSKFHILQLRNAEINEEKIIKRRATAVLSWLDCSSTAARLGKSNSWFSHDVIKFKLRNYRFF